jgi:hypothetical protein
MSRVVYAPEAEAHLVSLFFHIGAAAQNKIARELVISWSSARR